MPDDTIRILTTGAALHQQALARRIGTPEGPYLSLVPATRSDTPIQKWLRPITNITLLQTWEQQPGKAELARLRGEPVLHLPTVRALWELSSHLKPGGQLHADELLLASHPPDPATIHLGDTPLAPIAPPPRPRQLPGTEPSPEWVRFWSPPEVSAALKRDVISLVRAHVAARPFGGLSVTALGAGITTWQCALHICWHRLPPHLSLSSALHERYADQLGHSHYNSSRSVLWH